MEVKLGKQMLDDLDMLQRILRRWSKEGQARYKLAHRRIGQRWRTEAAKRVPVDESTLKQRIVANTFDEGGGRLVTEVGSNVPQAVFTEFGTEFIAGGEVKARFGEPAGFPVLVTDAEAVKEWPAKSAEELFSGGGMEQMPWLRPAFNGIRSWAISELDAAYEPPTQV